MTDEVETTIRRIANDPQLRAIIANCFGVPPAYPGRHLWWMLQTPEHLYDRQLTTSHFHYGRENIVTIQGPAGSGFVEDTSCLHKATRPIAGDRLMLELGFGMRNHRRFPPPDRAAASMVPLGRTGSVFNPSSSTRIATQSSSL